MRKEIKYVFLGVAILVFLFGCGKKDQEIERLALPNYMFDQVKKSEEPCTEEENNKIETGISEWAKAYLLFDSTVEEKDKEILNQALYSSIVSDKERKKVKEDRDTFYKSKQISINNILTTINSAVPATYNGKNMGYVDCVVSIQGTRDKQSFEKKYSLELLVNYETDIVSVYEIGKISWE